MSQNNIDDEYQEENLHEVLQEEGDRIAYQEWDSGVMSGIVELYKYKETYFVIHESGIDEYNDPKEALTGSGISRFTDATKYILVDWSLS